MDEDDDDASPDVDPRLLQVSRPLYTENDLDELYEKTYEKVARNWRKSCKCYLKLARQQCTRNSLLQFLYRNVPVLLWLQKYSIKKNLVHDLSAGLTVGVMQIPQGMAYAMLTTLPPITGLYVSLIPIVVYFFLGTSRHGSLGTFAIVCLMVGAIIEPYVHNLVPPNVPIPINGTNQSTATQLDTASYIESQRIQVAISLSLLIGIVQVLMGIVHLGFVSVFLSDPLVTAFTTGAAFHILASQVKHFLGISVPINIGTGPFSLFKITYYLSEHIAEANYVSLLIGAGCCGILQFIRYINDKYKAKLKVSIPGELVVVILGTALSYGFNFHNKYGVLILKNVPKGFPGITIPSVDIMANVWPQSIVIAIVVFAINVSMAKALAKKNNYEIDANQELMAYGFANAISAFFSCFPSGISMSRSLLQAKLGKTQLASMVSVGLLVLVLVSLAPIFEPLPKSVLAAIILVALQGLFRQFSSLRPLIRVSKYDGCVWVTTFVGVIILGVDYGLAVGIIANLTVTIFRTSRPSYALLGQLKNSEIYRSNTRYDVHEHEGIKIFQYCSPLFYANVEHFRDTLYKEVLNPAAGVQQTYVAVMHCGSGETTDSSDTEDSEGKILRSPKKHLTELPAVVEDVECVHYSANSETVGFTANSSHHGNGNVKHGRKHKPSLTRIHSIIIDCSKMSFIDSMAVGAIRQLTTEFKAIHVMLLFACCTDKMKDVLISGGFFDSHSEIHLFVTVHDAVIHSLMRHKSTQAMISPPKSPPEVKFGRSFSVA